MGQKLNIVFAIAVTAALAVTSAIVLFMIRDVKEDDTFVQLSEVMKGEMLIQGDTFILSISPELSKITVLDELNSRSFILFDRQQLIKESYEPDNKFNMRKALKSQNVNIKSFDYIYMKNDIAIGIKETGEARLFYRSDTSQLSIERIGYINNLAKSVSSYKMAKEEDEKSIILFTTNMEPVLFNAEDNTITINKGKKDDGTEDIFKMELPQQIAVSITGSNVVQTIITASSYVLSANADRNPMFTIPLNDGLVIYIIDKSIIKLYNTQTNTYAYIKDEVKEDYQGTVRLK